MKASALRGKEQSIMTDYILRMLGLEVSTLPPLSDLGCLMCMLYHGMLFVHAWEADKEKDLCSET